MREPGIVGSTAAEFAQARFGGRTRLLQRVVSVGITATRLLDNNPKRVSWVANNRSANNGAVGWAADVAVATGLLVGAAGGFVQSDVELDGEVVAWEVFAINDVAAGDWNVIEVMRV